MAITRVGGSWIHKYVSLVADDVTHTYTRAANQKLNLPNGSRCFEMDSDTEYIYDRENDVWEVYVPSSGGGGGSGGTTNYNQLSNKPKINNVELSGNKTLAALGITAGSVGFDETETYTDGSVGKELSDQKNAISQLVTDKAEKTTYVTLSGTIVTQTGADNTMYLCGELAELTFNTPAQGQTSIRFRSGTTPTIASFPNVTEWMGGFDPNNLEASVLYEINVLYGVGAAQWT